MDGASLFSMKGKTCLVTGGSIGIGKMIAEGFCANGATVYICSRKAKACEETAKELNDRYPNGKAISLPGDLSSIQGVEKLVADMKHVDKLHVLINNAGVTWGAPFEDYPDDAWQKILDLNVRHVFNLTKLLTPKLANAASQGDPARVVLISSADGVRAQQTYGPTAAFAYTTSKGAVIHMGYALCRALSPHNITVNTVAPGVFPSKMTRFMMKNEAVKSAIEEANPLKRNGTPEDMAGTLLYLCSRAGAFTNGAVILLDGGSVHHEGPFSSKL